MPEDGVECLASFMASFFARNTTAPQPAPTPAGLPVEIIKRRAPETGEVEEIKVLITEKLDDQATKLFSEAGINVDVKQGLKEDEICSIIAEYDGLVVRSATTVTAKIIEAGKKLRIIGRAGVGVDNINLNAATERGVIVCNSPQGNTTSAAEHTWGMILAMARRIPQAHAKLIKGEWDRKSFVGVELEGKALGILGFGNVGKKVARYALAFGMKVFAYDPFVTKEQGAKLGVTMMELDQVLFSAEVVTLHLPAIKETIGLLNRRTLGSMKRGVMIANVARGECVDEEALADALRTGQVSAAALDVFSPEPLDPSSPLLALSNVVVTPHLGASTLEAQVRVAVDVAEQMVSVFNGGPARAAVNIPTMRPDLIEPVRPFLSIAEKLGALVAQLSSSAISKLRLECCGGLSQLDVSPLSTALLKGLLDKVLAAKVNFVNALPIAKSRGLDFEAKSGESARGYANLLHVVAECVDGTRTEIGGTHFGEIGDRIVLYDGLNVDIAPVGWMLFINSPDTPGIIGAVGTYLGVKDINIACMEVGRHGVGDRACMILTIDQEPTDEVVQGLPKAVPGLRKACVAWAGSASK
eukprot:TRINITY_DN22121_c0_g1_i3.p1 TRINITY_DN22121_c0_g1~~TRINITY_DN22121_c0_g1_i3.p1  ORF type:complete len:584 (-),score=97.83 TRINITY_DN22121_c0_g1_i3:49-1800(-)